MGQGQRDLVAPFRVVLPRPGGAAGNSPVLSSLHPCLSLGPESCLPAARTLYGVMRGGVRAGTPPSESCLGQGEATRIWRSRACGKEPPGDVQAAGPTNCHQPQAATRSCQAGR